MTAEVDRASTSRGSARTSRSSTGSDQRPAHRLPRLGRLQPEAPRRCSRPWSASTRRRNAHVHRSAYQLATDATEAFEMARLKVQRFINAPTERELRLHQERHRGPEPRRPVVGPGQPARGRRRGAHPDGAPRQHRALADPGGRAGHRAALGAASPPTACSTSPTSTELLDGAKAFCFTAMSNVLGTINPVRWLTDAAHAHGAVAVVDACQYVPHVPTDVQAMGADFLAFSRPQDVRADRASACCGAARSCSTPCRRSSAAAT